MGHETRLHRSHALAAPVFAVYLVDAKTAAEITGEAVAAPAVAESYQGPWYVLEDKELGDVEGSDKFSGLKSAAFPGNAEGQEEAEAVPAAAPAVPMPMPPRVQSARSDPAKTHHVWADLREEVIDPSFDFEGPKMDLDDL